MTKYFLITILVLLFVSAHGQSILYSTPAGAGNLSGSSWGNALPASQLRSRLASAASGTQCWLAGGAYAPGQNRTETFLIPTGVQVYGGFQGNETTLTGRVLTTPSSTTLTGEVGDPAATGDNLRHVVTFTNASADTRLDGVCITGGNADGNALPDNAGGGIYNNGSGNGMQSTPTIVNCQLINNTAINGGGLYNDATNGGKSSPSCQNCLFLSNSAVYNGGGIYNDGNRGICNSQLINCQFRNNTATIGAGFYAIALFNSGYNVPVLTNCLFADNRAVNGAALSIISGFYAYLNSTLKNCLIVHNQATGRGGGLNVSATIGCDANLTLINCTVADNDAPSGKGIYSSRYSDSSVTLLLTNSIVWNNDFSYDISSNTTAPTYAITYSTIQGGFVGTGNSSVAPLFVDAVASNYRLTRASPCINTGNPASTTATVSQTDLAGNSRVFGNQIDMGAYEFIPYADLRMSLKTSNRTPAVNQPVSYSLSITNDGPEPATTVAWYNQLPQNLEFIGGASVSNSFNLVYGSVASLAPGATALFTYQVQPTQPGQYINAAQITYSDQPDPDSQPASGTGDGQDDAAQVDFRTTTDNGAVYASANPNQVPLPAVLPNQPPTDPAKADLRLTMTLSNRTPKQGDLITVRLMVDNAGGLTATGVALKLNLPPGLSFVSGNGFSSSGQTVTGTIGSVSVGIPTTALVQVRVDAAVSSQLTAEISASDQPDPDSQPNSGIADGQDDTATLDFRVAS